MHNKTDSQIPLPEEFQEITNQLVSASSRLQKWATEQTPLENRHHITFPQVSALYAVRYGAETPGAVAIRMEITPRAVTSHIDVLESRGLLVRKIDPSDRRRTLLTLTEEGEELSRHIERTALTALSEYIGAAASSDREALVTTIAVINDFLHSVAPTKSRTRTL